MRTPAALLAALTLTVTGCAPTSDTTDPGARGGTAPYPSAVRGTIPPPPPPSTKRDQGHRAAPKPRATPSTATAPPTGSATGSASPTKQARPAVLKPGTSGSAVRRLQQDLTDLGYWLGVPDGTYGDLTSQAVTAVQKAAGLSRDGIAGPATLAAVQDKTLPPVTLTGDGTEIDLTRQTLTIVRGGKPYRVLNTSTGNNATYLSQGMTKIAATPTGTYQVLRGVNGSDPGPLGALWRPRYFNGGIAVHGYTSVPPYPASHGCARVSNPAMDMLWAQDLMPLGSTVLVR